MTVGIPQSFPPYYGLDEDGNPVGFAVDFMDAVAERAGFEVTYRVAKTGGDNFEALLAGRIDIIPSLGISEKRARHVAFTASVETFHVSLFVRDATQDVRGLDDLAGRKVAVIADNVARHLLAPRDDIAQQVFPHFTDALFALLAGRVDALAYPEPVAWKLAREARVANQLKVVGRPLFEIKRAMAVRKDNVELLALLDLAVGELVASPDYRGIYVAWFGEPSPFWTPTRAAWAMGILFALSLIAMAGWRYRIVIKLNSQLEQHVQARTVELRSAVAALRESEDRFRDLAESASDWFWEFGPDLRITYVSDRIREVTGVEPSSIVGVHVRDLPTVNREDSDWNAYIDALEEHRPFRDLVCQRRVDDGSIRYLQVSGRPVFNDEVGFLGFRCVATDLTARVRAEEALREARDELEQRVEQRTAELRETNEQLKKEIAERKQAEGLNTRLGRIVEDSVNEVYVFDSESLRFIQVNRGARENLGYSMEELRGLTPLDLKPQYTKQDFEELVRPLMDGTRDQIAFTTVHRRKDDSPYDVEVRLQLAETETRPVFFAVVQNITERKLAEKMLRESEARLRTFIDHSPTAISLKDRDGRFVLVNRVYERLVGTSSEEVIGKTSHDLFDKGFADAAAAHDKIVLDEGHAVEWERKLAFEDGVHTWIISKFPVRDATGSIVAIGAISLDITERKRVEQALRESEERFRAVVDHSPTKIHIKDLEGRYLLVNKEAEDLFGVTDADARGRTSLEIFSKEHAEAFRRHDAAVLEANHAIEAEEEWVRDDGVHTFLTVKFPIRDASGKPIAIGAIGTDITERKRAKEALQESEARLQRSVLDAPIPIMIHAEDGEVLMINQEWTSLTGYTHAEIPTISVWTELAFGPRGIADQSRERIGTLYGIEEEKSEGDYYITTKTGEPRIWDFRSSPLGKLPDGRHFVISMAMDVTERRMAHDELERRVEERTAELRAAQADLLRQERLATLGQLTATVSHELRNPLGVIRTSSFIARDDMNGATPRVRRALERIDRSVIRCDRIIDELLDFTRISGLDPEPTPIDIWLDGTLKEQALPAEITLRQDLGLAGTMVPFDRDRFRRAIINVFDNACQAMTGEVDPEAADAENSVLSVTTQRKNGRVEVIFEDRGPGIPADVLPKIFEPLFSTKGFGVGLGLPVVKQIMEQHGGGIEIDGAGASGTRVCLWLPAERPIRPQT